MLGEEVEKPVHWRKMKRIAGPSYPRSEELELQAMHDVQRFTIEEFPEWAVNTDGEADLRVRWRGHTDESEDTWEPLEFEKWDENENPDRF